jgi:hypothetical protein
MLCSPSGLILHARPRVVASSFSHNRCSRPFPSSSKRKLTELKGAHSPSTSSHLVDPPPRPSTPIKRSPTLPLPLPQLIPAPGFSPPCSTRHIDKLQSPSPMSFVAGRFRCLPPSSEDGSKIPDPSYPSSKQHDEASAIGAAIGQAPASSSPLPYPRSTVDRLPARSMGHAHSPSIFFYTETNNKF